MRTGIRMENCGQPGQKPLNLLGGKVPVPTEK